jgi:hypothetical protein
MYYGIYNNNNIIIIVMSRFRVVTVWGMDWMIGYSDHLYTSLGTTDNYFIIADLHTVHRYTLH